MSGERHVVVVRGGKTHPDANFCCLMNDGSVNSYGVLTFRGNQLEKRQMFSAAERAEVEKYTRGAQFRGAVFADNRKERGLLPLHIGKHCMPVDFAKYRRAKSDVEIDSLDMLHTRTRNMLDHIGSHSGMKFRGVQGERHVLQETQTPGFTQYRGGLKDTFGRMSDLTRIVAKTPAWEERMERVHRGLAKVASKVAVGASVTELNDAFLDELDKEKDTLYGNVVCHTGWEGNEASVPLVTLQPFDVVKVGAAVGGNDGHTALVYNGIVSVLDEPSQEVCFKGTHIGENKHHVLKQIERFPQFIAREHLRTGTDMDTLFRGICDRAGSGGCLSDVVHDVADKHAPSRSPSPPAPLSSSPHEPHKQKFKGLTMADRMRLRG